MNEAERKACESAADRLQAHMHAAKARGLSSKDALEEAVDKGIVEPRHCPDCKDSGFGITLSAVCLTCNGEGRVWALP